MPTMPEPKNRTFEATDLPVLGLKPAPRGPSRPGSETRTERANDEPPAIQPEQREEVVNRIIDRLKRI
jgi:hypothetical protein